MTRKDHYNVLIADDEYMLRQSLSRKISETDPSFVIVSECSEGKSALKELGNKEIHVVFTDIRMPEMDGLKLAKIIHENYPDIITVILTGYADFDYARESIRQGVFDYLLKPVSEENLSDVLEKISLKLSHIYDLPGNDEGNASDADMIIRSVEKYFKEHFREEIDLGELASSFGFSSAYLSRIFTKKKGGSPVRFLTEIRINEAKRLLATTNETIARVGELSGYPDQFYFSRIFRKETGENPTSYRKLNQKQG